MSRERMLKEMRDNMMRQHQQRLKEGARIRSDLVDIAADMGITLSPKGVRVMLRIVGGLAEEYHDHAECASHGQCQPTPEDTLRMGDQFMLMWVLHRYKSDPRFLIVNDPVELVDDERVLGLFIEVPEVKL